MVTYEQYQFLKGNFDDVTYFDTGISCYEEAFIDDFGIVTPKGQKAIEEYESRTLS